VQHQAGRAHNHHIRAPSVQINSQCNCLTPHTSPAPVPSVNWVVFMRSILMPLQLGVHHYLHDRLTSASGGSQARGRMWAPSRQPCSQRRGSPRWVGTHCHHVYVTLYCHSVLSCVCQSRGLPRWGWRVSACRILWHIRIPCMRIGVGLQSVQHHRHLYMFATNRSRMVEGDRQ
jgi:hypothetical protein